jgi:hypothetical protein
MQTKQFSTVTKGSFFASDEGRAIAVSFKRRALWGNILYGISKVFMFTAVFVQGQGPFSSSVFGIIILQNSLTFVYFVWFSFMAHTVVRKVSQMLEQTPSSNSGKGELEAVLTFMHEAARANFRTACVLGTLYVSFSTPYFIGYQTYMFAIGLIVTLPSLYHMSRLFVGGRKLVDAAARSKHSRKYSDGVTLQDIGLDGNMSFASFHMEDQLTEEDDEFSDSFNILRTPATGVIELNDVGNEEGGSENRGSENRGTAEPEEDSRRSNVASGNTERESKRQTHRSTKSTKSTKPKSTRVGSGRNGSVRTTGTSPMRSSGKRNTHRSRRSEKSGALTPAAPAAMALSSNDPLQSMNSASSLQRHMSL